MQVTTCTITISKWCTTNRNIHSGSTRKIYNSISNNKKYKNNIIKSMTKFNFNTQTPLTTPKLNPKRKKPYHFTTITLLHYIILLNHSPNNNLTTHKTQYHSRKNMIYKNMTAMPIPISFACSFAAFINEWTPLRKSLLKSSKDSN